jgi:CDP-diacylglycerol--glycerol-3-phosphate 3-phosphatidyltransferase
MSLGSIRAVPATGSSAEAAAVRRLTRAWRWWCLASLAGLVAASALLWPAFGADLARWLIPDLVASAGILAFVRSRLPLNRRSPDGPLLGDLGAGNHWTISRGILIGQLPGYLFLPWPDGPQAWLPTLTFTIALVGDFVDGYLARRASAMTQLGEALDIEFDGTGLLAATALAAHYGQLPVVYLMTVGMARYCYLLAGWVAMRAGRRLRALPPSTTRRGLAGVTMELAAAAPGRYSHR